MRVGIVAPFHDFGGSEHQILLLLRELRQKDIEFVFFHLNIRSPELRQELESIEGCRHVEIPLRSIKNPFLFVPDALTLARLLRRQQCDLVHCWNYTGHIIGGVAAKMVGVPCIFSIRGLDPWKKTWQLPFYRLLNRLADIFVFQSATGRDIVSQREGIPLVRTHLVHNGVDHRRFQIANRNEARFEIRRNMNLPLAVPVILSVGSLRAIKGHDILIEAVRGICSMQPDLPFQVVIVGDGPLREAYEQSARGLPLSFAGFQKNVEQFYLAADLYCQPSRSEGLPNAVIEAMCCGLPLIASDVGGTTDLVTVDNGLLCEPGDSEALARQLYAILSHSEMWPSMSLASLKASERFSVERMADSYVSLYRGLLGHVR